MTSVHRKSLLLIIYNEPDTVLNALHTLVFNSLNNPGNDGVYNLHFTGKETED